ncbi:MAG: hypothetical protein ACRC2R_07260 [Xenococcaceae cyanobacterium]
MEPKPLPVRSLTTSAIIPEASKVDNLSEDFRRSGYLDTINLAAEDIRWVIAQQKERSYLLTTKLNILFVVNGALWTSLMISKLVFNLSPFSCAEILGFVLNFTLLINAFLPRQEAVSPNLEDTKFLEKYLTLTPEEYRLQMMVNSIETYNVNKQRIDDVSQSLTYSAYVTWTIALVIMLHVVAVHFVAKLPF